MIGEAIQNAITGASGSIYGVRLLEVLLGTGHEGHLLISPAAKRVFQEELGVQVDLAEFDLSQILPEDPAADSRTTTL